MRRDLPSSPPWPCMRGPAWSSIESDAFQRGRHEPRNLGGGLRRSLCRLRKEEKRPDRLQPKAVLFQWSTRLADGLGLKECLPRPSPSEGLHPDVVVPPL